MILNEILQKAKLDNFRNKRNKKKILILKKNFSDISMPIGKRNLSAKNSLASSIHKKKAKLMQSKLINLLDKDSDKTSRIMEKTFYLRNREGLKDAGKSSELFSGIMKNHENIVNKILMDFKNIKSYDREVLKNNRNNYNRNLEYLENQNLVKKAQRLKEDKKFQKLKNSDIHKTFYSGKNFKSVDSFPSSLYSSPKLKTVKKKPSMRYIREKEFILEDKANDALLLKRQLNHKRLKENAKSFCDKVRNLDLYCKFYERINNINRKKNLEKNILFNLGNLERIVKLKSLRDKGYDNEDYEGSAIFLKKSYDKYNYFCDKAISGYFPGFVKKEGFLNRTMTKFAYLQGKFFGLPV